MGQASNSHDFRCFLFDLAIFLPQSFFIYVKPLAMSIMYIIFTSSSIKRILSQSAIPPGILGILSKKGY